MTIRERTEQTERQILHPKASFSDEAVRDREEEPCPIRTAFQRDRDRIIHSKAFRRLKHKTQVFLSPTGDHYRTRLTHTLEVAQIARTIARALRLNEDLAEAIVMGHDLGHTPFGHAGEGILNELVPGGFQHFIQSLRVVEVLEKNGQGLNLTFQVRDGIVRHSKRGGSIQPSNPKAKPATLEGLVVRFADVIAYVNHDLDDSLRAGFLKEEELPQAALKAVGETHSKRIHNLVSNVVYTSLEKELETVDMATNLLEPFEEIRSFLYANVYLVEKQLREPGKVRKVITDLYRYFMERPEEIETYGRQIDWSDPKETNLAVADYIAGMTDRFAIQMYQKLFVPDPWMGAG